MVDYLSEGRIPDSKKEAKKLNLRSTGYELRDGVSYKRSYLNPLLRCLSPNEADYVLCETHE